MDALEELLRRDFRDAVPMTDDSERMLAQVRRRRLRGRLTTAAAVAVLLVTAGVIVLWGRHTPPPPTNPQPVVPSHSAPQGLQLPRLIEAEFPSAQVGYTVAMSCTPTPCTTWLMSTVDGGASWQPHLVPDLVPESFGPRATLRVFDDRHVLLDDYDGNKRWATADGGASWRMVDPRPQGTIDTVPADAKAVLETEAGDPIKVIVTRPDGTSAYLRKAPEVGIISAMSEVLRAQDGSLWLEGADDEHNWRFVSRDQGRSWIEIPAPPGYPTGGQVGFGDRLLTYDGHTVYCVDSATRRAWRSTDDGTHWMVLDTSAAPVPTGDYQLSPAATRSNGLILLEPITGQVVGVDATGTRLAVIADYDPGTVPPQRGARYIRQARPEGSPVEHSLDARSWTQIKF